jgi:hypothetical protein
MYRLTRTGYRRLPGWGPRRTGLFSGVGTRCRLYLAKDHILAVDNHWLSEDYKRFYFSDIQAIVTRKTKRWIAEGLVVVLVAACMMGLSLPLLDRSRPIGAVWMGLSFMVLLYLIYHLSRGPSCACHVVTAIQEDVLPTINRMRISRRVVPLLKSAAERAQGTVSAEEMAAAPIEKGPRYGDPEWHHFPGVVRQSATTRLDGGYRGWAHLIVFCLLIFFGIQTAADLGSNHVTSLRTLSVFLGAAFCVFLVIALIKQRGGAAFGAVRSMTWASFALLCVSACLAYAVMVSTTIHMVMLRPKSPPNQFDILRTMMNLSPHSSPFLMSVYGFESICSLILGGLGLGTVLRWRRKAAARPASRLASEGGMTAP